MSGLKLQVADRARIAEFIDDAPVAVGAGQLVASCVPPGVAGGEPLGANLAADLAYAWLDPRVRFAQ